MIYCKLFSSISNKKNEERKTDGAFVNLMFLELGQTLKKPISDVASEWVGVEKNFLQPTLKTSCVHSYASLNFPLFEFHMKIKNHKPKFDHRKLWTD